MSKNVEQSPLLHGPLNWSPSAFLSRVQTPPFPHRIKEIWSVSSSFPIIEYSESVKLVPRNGFNCRLWYRSICWCIDNQIVMVTLRRSEEQVIVMLHFKREFLRKDRLQTDKINDLLCRCNLPFRRCPQFAYPIASSQSFSLHHSMQFCFTALVPWPYGTLCLLLLLLSHSSQRLFLIRKTLEDIWPQSGVIVWNSSAKYPPKVLQSHNSSDITSKGFR